MSSQAKWECFAKEESPSIINLGFISFIGNSYILWNNPGSGRFSQRDDAVDDEISLRFQLDPWWLFQAGGPR